MSLRAQRKAETHAQIAAAARALLEEQGFEGTTFRAIARRAGVSVGTVHNYAGSKAQLVVDLLVDDLEQTIAAGLQTLPPPPLIGQLMHLFSGFLHLYAAHPALARTYIKESMFASDPAFGRYLQLTAGFAVRLGGLAEASGQLREGVAPLLAGQLLLDSYLSVVVLFLRDEVPSVPLAQAALQQRLIAILELLGP